MTLPELLLDLERRAREADAIAASAPLAAVYRQIMGELRQLRAADVAVSYDCDAAGRLLGVSPKTVAHWCKAGKFPGARKTGGSGGGKWIIPATALRAYQRREAA